MPRRRALCLTLRGPSRSWSSRSRVIPEKSCRRGRDCVEFSLPFGRERTAEIDDSLRGEHEYKVVASVAERTAIESAERAVQLPHDGAVTLAQRFTAQ